MSEQTGPAEVAHAVTEALSRGDIDAAVAGLAEEAVDHSAPDGAGAGPASWRERWEAMRRSVPDLSFELEQSVEAGDMVANRYRMRGTPVEAFMDVEATGAAFDVLVLDMVRVRGGKVAEHWALVDLAAVSAQVGGVGG
jgi:predicted ester cyclase